MKVLALAPVLAFAAFALAAPPRADAADRYRHDGYRARGSYGHYESRGYAYRGDRGYGHYYAPRHYRSYHYAPRVYGYYNYGYYDPYYSPSYYGGYYDGYYGVGYGYPPPVRRYCPPRRRAHVGVYFGF